MTPVVGIPACARVHKDIDILWHEAPARWAERPGGTAIFKAFGDACRTGKLALTKAA
jgi:hypothetical protein